MILQPHLTGQLLTLRPLLPEDFEELYQAASDPLIWELHPQNTRYQRPVFEQFFALAMESKGALAVIDNASGRMIGSSRFYDYRPELSQVIIGYTFLGREFWGGHYNKEMKGLMIGHAFQSVNRVLFEIGKENFRSRCAIEKLGAQLIDQQQLDSKSHVIYCIDKKYGVTDWGRLYSQH